MLLPALFPLSAILRIMAIDSLLTLIVPHRESDATAAAVKAAREACVSAGLPFRMLLVSGNNPTKQRNICVEKTETEYYYFLDNDTLLTKEALFEFLKLVELKDKFSVLGGPVLTPVSDSVLQKCIGFVFSLPYVLGKIASRYSARGVLRETDDSELILCNLIVKAGEFKEHGGFNEKLYPNEENEFIFRLKSTGHRVLYSPEFAVIRSQRESFGAFIGQILTYGRGRGEQTRVSPGSFRLALLFPLFYPFIFLTALVLDLFSTSHIFCYITAALFIIPVAAWLHALSAGLNRAFFVPLLVFLAHMLYAFGFLSGYFSKTYKADRKDFECKITEVN